MAADRCAIVANATVKIAYDVYRGKTDPSLRLATAPGACLPAHVNAKDWDIGVQGYCFFQVSKGALITAHLPIGLALRRVNGLFEKYDRGYRQFEGAPHGARARTSRYSLRPVQQQLGGSQSPLEPAFARIDTGHTPPAVRLQFFPWSITCASFHSPDPFSFPFCAAPSALCLRF